MRKTEFYLIVKNVDNIYKYVCGFKSLDDANSYVTEFGGTIETINTIFYSDIEDARKHQSNITSMHEVFSQFSSLSEDEKILFKESHPELINQLKQLL